jgi:hypothetical protein
LLNVIGWKKSKTTGDTLRTTVVLRKFAGANDGILGGDHPALDMRDTEINSKIEVTCEGQNIALNGQGPRCFGDVPAQPQSMCYTERILRSKLANNGCRTHLGHRRDRHSILVTLST